MTTGQDQDPPGDALAWPAEIATASDRLFTEHYEALETLASALRRRRPDANTLLTGDLLHEGFLKLRRSGPWKDERHFLQAAACAMRHVQIDRARARLSEKRNRGATAELDDGALAAASTDPSPEDVVAMADLLAGLARQDPRLLQVVDCRFFAGYTQVETADILGVDERTIRRDWNRARAWLLTQLGGSGA